MSDSFQQSLHIASGPAPQPLPTNSAEALEVTDPYQEVADNLDMLGWSIDYGFRVDWTPSLVKECIEHDETFTVDEGRWDELETLGEVLSKHGFCWWGVVHPKYEYLGTYHAFTPELGLFTAECDDDGTVQISAGTLQTWIKEAASLEELKKRVDEATGAAWDAVLFKRRWVVQGTNRQVGAIGVHEPFTEIVEARWAQDAQDQVREIRQAAGFEHVLIQKVGRDLTDKVSPT